MFNLYGADMKKFTMILFGVTLFFANAWAQESGVFTTTLIHKYDHGAKWWRIPAIETVEDTVVAVFDKRYGERTDLPNPISIVAMRSTDNGTTWSSPVFVAERGNGHTYGDASLVLDTVTNELFCMFVGEEGFFQSNTDNRAVIYYSKSKDAGKTWTAPTSINNQIFTGTRSEWKAAFAASGGALQLKSGRLMFVLCVRPNDDNGDGYVDNWTLYSDDHGTTWKVSNNRATESGNEAKVVELDENTLLMSIRNHAKGWRIFCKSYDGGVNWQSAYTNETLKDADCNGDILAHNYNGKRYLLHSLPNSASRREYVSVFVSDDDGETWNHHKQLVDGPAAYSSLTILPNGEVGCLIEEGHDGTHRTTHDPDSAFNIIFHRFSMDWLLQGMNQNAGGEEATGTLVLDGGSRYMRIPDHDDFDMPAIANNRYTISLRAKKASITDASERYMGKRANHGNGWELWGATDQHDFAVNTTPNYSLPGGKSSYFTYGNDWNHLCWVFDGPSKKSYYYINGNLTSTTSITNNANSTTSLANDLDVLVGCGYSFNSTSPDFYFDGEIDDLHFYKSALSETQVTTDMNAFDPTTAQALNLVAAYDFEQISGTTVPDISGNGHTATLVGYSVVNPDQPVEKYKTPDGSMHANSTTYVERIYTENAHIDINKTWSGKPNNVYQLVDQTVTAIQGKTFNLHLDAYEATTRTGQSSVYQDLRFDAAVIFTDWDSNGRFDKLTQIGLNPPTSNTVGNLNVLDINQSIAVPATAPLGETRIRVIYNNAWEHGFFGAPNANTQAIVEGMAYDIVVNVISDPSAIDKTPDNTLLYYCNGYVYTNLDGKIQLYDIAGNLVRQAQTAPVAAADLAGGIYIVRVNGETLKFVK